MLNPHCLLCLVLHCNYNGAIGPKKRFGHNFWLEGPINLRTMRLNCILQDFSGTPHLTIFGPPKYAPKLHIWPYLAYSAYLSSCQKGVGVQKLLCQKNLSEMVEMARKLAKPLFGTMTPLPPWVGGIKKCWPKIKEKKIGQSPFLPPWSPPPFGRRAKKNGQKNLSFWHYDPPPLLVGEWGGDIFGRTKFLPEMV